MAEAGAEDPEHARTTAVPRLQRKSAKLVDDERTESVLRDARDADRLHDYRRLKDLRGDTVGNEWIWSLAPSSRHTLESEVYVDAVRLRLGAQACGDF